VASPVSVESRAVRRSEHAQRLVPIDKLDAAELTDRVACLGDGLRDKPGADHTRRHRPADRSLVVGEHGPFFIDPAGEVSGTGAGNDVGFAAAPVRERAPVADSFRQAAAPVPGKVLAP
jgi:hypothetical protein